MAELTRYEINARVRGVLIRHHVDLALLNYSASEHAVHLYGELRVDDGADMTVRAVETLLEEITYVRSGMHIVTDLRNWEISSESGSYKARPRKSEGRYASAQPRHFEIDEAALLRDLLDNEDPGES